MTVIRHIISYRDVLFVLSSEVLVLIFRESDREINLKAAVVQHFEWSHTPVDLTGG